MQLTEGITHQTERLTGSWTGAQILVVALCFLINMVDGMDVLILSYVAPTLGGEWGLTSSALGVVFSAGLAGMAIGGILIAPLADRLGRRKLILFALLLMTAGMIGSAFTGGIVSLVVARVIVGAGIGTVLACMAAIAAEYAPPRYRNFAVGFLQAGYPIGATLTGFVTAALLPLYGWRPMLLGAGCVSALLTPVIFRYLPESIAFLIKLRPPGALQSINRLHARMGLAPLKSLPAAETVTRPAIAAGAIFANDRTVATLLLWLAVFSGFMVLYFIVSWIPRLAIAAGLDPSAGIYAGAIYNIGAFAGTVGLSWLATYVRLQWLIAISLFLAAAVMLIFGGIAMPVGLVLVTAFVLGTALQGGFNGIYPLAAQLYPAEIRSTGIGWAMGIGRAGAVIGPLLGGAIMGLNAPSIVLFTVFAVPLLVAGGAAFSIRIMR